MFVTHFSFGKQRAHWRVGAFMRAAGHAPIMMSKEIDGFVMNRLQGALLQEAFRLVAEWYASTADVDIGIRDGLGLRWSFMGPFETIDLNAPAGVADYIARFRGRARYQRMIFAVHTPRGELTADDPDVQIWDGPKIAELVVKHGLGDWVASRL